MIDSQELLLVVNENNQPIEPKLRSIVHQNGLWHRTTGVWVINNKKQILCQKRSFKKDIRPGEWEAFFGGHLAPEEEYKHNAIIELSEELGIKVKENNLIPYKTLKSDKPTHKEYQGIFAYILDEEQDFKYEKDEIDQLVWKDIEEVRGILLNNNTKNWIQKPWDQEALEWLNKL